MNKNSLSAALGLMILRNQHDPHHAHASQTLAAPAVVAEVAEPVMQTVSFKAATNAKYKKVKNEKGELETALEPVFIDVDGKKTQVFEKDGKTPKMQKVVEIPSMPYAVNVSVPAFESLTPDVIKAIYESHIHSLVKPLLKDETISADAVFSYELSAADMIGEVEEITDDMVAAAQKAFMEFCASIGKSEKAQKNNAALLVQGWKRLQQTDQRIRNAYEENLTRFLQSDADVSEYVAVLQRATKALDKAKNASLEDII